MTKNEFNKRQARYSAEYRKRKPWWEAYNGAKRRCKVGGDYSHRGIKFLMTMEDFKFLWFRDKAFLMKHPSIDRRDGTKNYTLKNCQFLEMKDNSKKVDYKQWAKFKQCIDCRTNKKPYLAKGRCNPCYQKYNYNLHGRKDRPTSLRRRLFEKSKIKTA